MRFWLAAFDPWFVRLNLIEACVWFVIGLGVLFYSNRKPTDLILVIALIAFGVSDLVETKTGGWYKPWWMFLWKTICVLTFAPIVISKLKRSKIVK